MTENIIKVSGLSKIYRNGTEAVKNMSFEVKSGEFFAFLGPNGAGKSTTIKILTTLIRASSGIVEIAGYNLEKQPSKIRFNIGTALQNTAIDPALTGREILTTQYLEEADKMADKIAIIKNGELAVFGNPSSLKGAIDKNKTDYRNTTLEDVFFEVVTK